jgi:hypothetical protein
MARDMKQIPLLLDTEMYETLRRMAYEQKIAMAEIIRRALAEYLGKPRKGKEEGK